MINVARNWIFEEVDFD